jgi:DNA-binding NtrC family response regulator
MTGDVEAKVKEISAEAVAILTEYSWPGNVRELENVIERVVVNATGDTIDASDLPSEILANSSVQVRNRKERRRTVADELFTRLMKF